MTRTLWKAAALFLGAALSLGTIRETRADEAVRAVSGNSTNMQLYAQSAVLMDAGSGRILFEKNGHEMMPMASTTKIMTCILALENGNLEDYVEASAYAVSMPKVKLNMKQGEYFKLKDLLYSLMLESHNDSAAAIAEHIAGSKEAFAGMMNQKARDIGCFDTFFITPNGLDATATASDGTVKKHATTASDLAKIMSYCIMDSPAKESFLTITRTNSYAFEGYKQKEQAFVPDGRTFHCNNHNAFLSMMEGALSGKTGFTGNAGYCYVGSLKRENRTFVVALLACGWPNNKTYKWSDTKKLMSYGIDNYQYHDLDEVKFDPANLEPIPVSDGQTEQIGGMAFTDVEITRKLSDGTDQEKQGVLLTQDEKIEVECKIKNSLKAPVSAGTEVGSIYYKVDGEIYRSEFIVTKDSVPAIDYKWCLKQIFNRYSV